MQQQQSKVSYSTQHRYSHHSRIQLLPQYKLFKSQYENFLSNSKIQELKVIYPHAILGRNQQSNIVVLDRLGAIKANQISKVLDEEQIFGYIMQRLLYLAEHALKDKERVVWVIDLSGKIMQLASKKNHNIVEKIVKNAQKYFPGLLHKLFFINTPMLFDAIWNKVSQTIDSYTISKIVHLTDDLAQLIQQVNLSLLPEYLGGKQQDQILTKLDDMKQQKNQSEDKKNNSEQQNNEQPEYDFSSLKMALSGLKLGGGGNKSVAQTPLNTEADDTK